MNETKEELNDEKLDEPSISLLYVTKNISGILIMFEMMKYRYLPHRTYLPLNEIWFDFQDEIIEYIAKNRSLDMVYVSQIIDAISACITKKMRDYINYVDNNLFSGLRNGVAQRNVRTMIIKACIGFLGNISPNLLKNVYLSRILNDTMFISEIDFAIESYIEDPVPSVHLFIADTANILSDLNKISLLDNLDRHTFYMIDIKYSITNSEFVRSIRDKYYKEDDNIDELIESGVEKDLKRSGQWSNMFVISYDIPESSSDDEY